MSQEQKVNPIALSNIRIDLKERSIIFEAGEKPVAKLTLAPEGVIYEAVTDKPEAPVVAPSEPQPQDKQEKEPKVTLTGRLKAQPRQGRADRSQNPTAYARFSAHVEGEGQAHEYIATFHRHTAGIAMKLPKDAQITVEGYPHPSGSEKRLDTISVFNIVAYPGKERGK